MISKKITNTELKQRADGVWVLWGYVPDPTQKRSEWKETGMEAFFPWRWVPLATYDYLMEVTFV